MKLAAIYNVWDGDELLDGSIKCIEPFVDELIIVYQNISNFGHKYRPDLSFVKKGRLIEYVPTMKGWENEMIKRRIGINRAKELGCTHFILMDCDEYYERDQFAKAIKFLDGGSGVCRMHTYFKRPTLKLEHPENYFVPFIHRLNPDTQIGNNKYKFYCDRTRVVNEHEVIQVPDDICMMHHFSWVRKDINKKIQSSSAQDLIQNKGILADYNRPLVSGDWISSYDQKLIEVPNLFNIQL